MAPGRKNIKDGVEREHMAQKVIVVRAQFLPRSGLLKVVELVRITRDMHRDGIVMIRGKGTGRGTQFRLNVIRWKTLTQVKCSDSLCTACPKGTQSHSESIQSHCT